MSLVEQFEYLLSRRTCQKSFQMKRGKSTQPSNTLLSLNKLSQSIYDEAFVQKINSSPCKNNVEKFQELRRKLATRGSERSKRVSMKSTNRDYCQGEELSGNTIDLIPNVLLCSKAIVHNDLRQHEVVWKKGLKQIVGEETKSKDLDEEGSTTTNFLKPKRRFSQDIPCSNFGNTIFIGKHTKLNRPKNGSHITTGSAESPEQRSPSQSYRIKYSARKPISNKSDLTKETKSSDNDLGFDKIDPWNSYFEEQDGVMF